MTKFGRRMLVLVLAMGFCLGGIVWPTHGVSAVGQPVAVNPDLVGTFTDGEGRQIDELRIGGRPPVGWVAPAVVLPSDSTEADGTTRILTGVPAFDWSYGCSATSAAMLFGYYDRLGYPDMYVGPTNGGVCPLSNSAWGSGETPISASHKDIDGRATKGSVDDYWVKYGSTTADPYITGSWTQHAPLDCTADYMGTNQSKYGNSDGSTSFYFYDDGRPLVDYMAPAGTMDGCHGMRMYAQYRGYNTATNFSQYIAEGPMGEADGFSFALFTYEIDAGRPVLIHCVGHTMLAFGYSTTDKTIYIHDTWDHLDHSMTWGGSYSGLQQYGVTVIRLTLSAITHTITTSVSGGHGTLVPSGEIVPEGSTAYVRIMPAVGYHLSALTDNGTVVSPLPAGTNYPIWQVDADHTITGAFASDTHALTVSNAGSGTVTLDPAGGTYAYGTVVALTAAPAAGWHFTGWSGDLTGTTNPATVTMDADKTITAIFAINTYILSTGQVGNGVVSKDPSQATYNHGTSVSLTATPAPGWTFTSWSGDVPAGHESDNPLSLTMDADKTVTATFVESPISSLVTHYYSSILGRSPDEPGRVYWVNEITRVQSLGIDVREGFIALARLFFTSPEYVTRATSDAAYITDLYTTFFNRTPDPVTEVQYWTDLMAAGMSRDITMNWFVYSPEYAAYMTSVLGSFSTRPENNLVNDLYRGFLNRLPDTDGFTAQLNAMRTAQAADATAVRSTTLAIALAFEGGPEYALRARTNTQFIEDCYNGILRRGALAAEIQGWVTLLTDGATRTEVLTGFVNSTEFQARVDQVIAAGPFVP